jgi:hypothetical protein
VKGKPVIANEKTVTKYALWDLDNCLADDSARIALINWSEQNAFKRYEAYHEACENDPVGNYPLFARMRDQQVTPVFLTARPLSIREKTLAWISNNLGIEEPMLIMRNIFDHRPSVDVKREMVAALPNYDIADLDIVAAFDDRQDIVDMYRACGLPGHLLKIHDVCAYEPPKPRHPTEPLTELERVVIVHGVDAASRGHEKMERAMLSGKGVEPVAGWVEDLSDLARHHAERERACAVDAPRPRNAPDILAKAAETFRERNALYGNNYVQFGPIAAAMFPEGLTLKSAEDFARFGVFVQALSKFTRYAANLQDGGHRDSAHDMAVYGAMLEELTR